MEKLLLYNNRLKGGGLAAVRPFVNVSVLVRDSTKKRTTKNE